MIICQFGVVDSCVDVYTCTLCLKVFPLKKNVCSRLKIPTIMNIIERKLSRELTHTVPHSSLVSHCSLEELGLGLHRLYRESVWCLREWD